MRGCWVTVVSCFVHHLLCFYCCCHLIICLFSVVHCHFCLLLLFVLGFVTYRFIVCVLLVACCSYCCVVVVVVVVVFIVVVAAVVVDIACSYLSYRFVFVMLLLQVLANTQIFESK